MGSENTTVDPVAAVADDFIARYRRGERPAISEYTDRHPELAERIRQVIPLMVMMEEAGSGASPAPTVGAAGPGDAEQRPERIGGYRVLREVGRGGMGVVYEAEQLAFGRRVALKVLRLHLAHHDSGLERFRREAKAAARLHHSNIVPVHEVGEDGDFYFYTMQFIQGQALDKVLEELKLLREAPSEGNGAHRPAQSPALSLLTDAYQGEEPLPRPAPSAAAQSSSVNLPGQTDRSAAGSGRSAYHRGVARVGVQAAEALDYAHREGVIHRDVKPSNLLLDADGRVWVADFGLAQTDGAALTVTGDVVGTVRYMAPERFRGWSDPRSDVYSLGLTLYEMLLLKPAFAGADRISLIHQITRLEPIRLRKVDPRIPLDLETIVSKAMDKEPSRRYQTAAELAADLRRFVDDKPILARRISRLERTWRWGRRNPVVAGLIAAVVLITVVGVAATVWQMRAAMANAKSAQDNERTAQDNAKKARDEADETKKANERLAASRNALHHNLYLSDMSGVQSAYEGDNLFRAQELLDRYRPGPGEPDERGFEWYYWQHQMHSDSELSSVLIGGPNEYLAAISPDGGRVAVCDLHNYGAVVKVFDTTTGDEAFSLPAPVAGNVLATPWLLNPTPAMQFSADGKQLAVSYASKGGKNSEPLYWFVLWDLSKRQALSTLLNKDRALLWALSPDARRIAATCPESVGEQGQRRSGYRLKVWDCADGSEVCSTPLSEQPWGQLAFSPDGGRIAFLAGVPSGARLQVRDASTGKELLAVDDVPFRPANSTLAFSPDGARLLASGHPADLSPGANDSGRIWDAVTGKLLLTLHDIPEGSSRIAIGPDGKYATWFGAGNGLHDSTLQVWDTTRGKVVCTFKGRAGGVQAVRYSPDGERLISMTLDGAVQTWRLPDVGEDPARAEAVTRSPDGTRVALCFLQRKPMKGVAALHEVRVRDNRTRKELLRIADLADDPVAWQFSADGKRLALVLRGFSQGGQRWKIQVWDVDAGTAAFSQDVVVPFFYMASSALLLGPDGRLVALTAPASDDPRQQMFTVSVWKVDTGEKAYTAGPMPFPGYLQLTADGHRFFAAVGDPGVIHVWDADSGRERSTIQTGAVVQQLTASRDGTRIAACTPDKSASGDPITRMRVWDADTGEELRSFAEYGPGLTCLELSPDGHFLAAVPRFRGLHDMGFVKVWDVRTGEPVQTLRGHNYPVVFVSFSPDGRRLASLATYGGPTPAAGEVVVWDVATGRPTLNAVLAPFQCRIDTTPIWFSPAGDRLIVYEWKNITDGFSLTLGRKTRYEVWDAAPLESLQASEKSPRTIAGWGEVVDPDGDCAFQEENGKLTITVPGTVHNLNGALFGKNKGLNAPRVLQTVDGDFTFQAKASADFKPGPVPAETGQTSYNGAGLVLWLPRGYLRVELAAYTTAKGETFFNVPLVEYWKDGTVAHPGAWYNQAAERPRSAYVRLERHGGEIRVGVSNDGQNWTYSAAPINIDLPSTVRVGVDAVNTSKLPFTVEFEELQLIQKPEEGADHPGRSAK